MPFECLTWAFVEFVSDLVEVGLDVGAKVDNRPLEVIGARVRWCFRCCLVVRADVGHSKVHRHIGGTGRTLYAGASRWPDFRSRIELVRWVLGGSDLSALRRLICLCGLRVRI